jgi:tRNA(His) 5'-end guanylyltransferase
MYDSLGSRQKDYEKAFDYEVIRRTPVIVRCDGRGFSRVLRKLKKPYEPLFLEAMAQTMMYVVGEMAGCNFAYAQSDEITFVLRNDQTLDSEPWYGNRIQKLASITASLATLGLNKSLSKLEKKLDITADALFDARVFGMPTLGECVNNLIWRQQDAMRNSVAGAAQVLLSAKMGKKTALKLLHGKSSKDKLQLMQDECGIDFNEEYPESFRLGVGAYKIPVIYGESIRKKWHLDWELRNFVEDRDFLHNIIVTGADVFRENSFTELDPDNKQ